jgi:hypothetical protein
VPQVRYRFTGRDLETIARNIGITRAPEPPGVLADIAAAIAAAIDDTDVQKTAGLLFTAILTARPLADDSIAFALEAARTFLIANGVRVARITDPERVLTLVDAVRTRALEDADEIGKRLAAL